MNEFFSPIDPEMIKFKDNEINDDSLKQSLWGILNERSFDELPYSYEQIVDACVNYDSVYKKVDHFLMQEAYKDKEMQSKVMDLFDQINKEVLRELNTKKAA